MRRPTRTRNADDQAGLLSQPPGTAAVKPDSRASQHDHLATRPAPGSTGPEDTAEFVISAYHQLFQIDPGQAFPGLAGPG